MNRVTHLYYKWLEKFILVPIKNDMEYRTALDLADTLSKLNENGSLTPVEVDYFDTLTMLVDAYETKKFAVDEEVNRTPIENLRFLMQKHNLKQNQLKNEIGTSRTVYEYLHGNREFRIEQVKKLARRFKVSPMMFIDMESD